MAPFRNTAKSPGRFRGSPASQGADFFIPLFCIADLTQTPSLYIILLSFMDTPITEKETEQIPVEVLSAEDRAQLPILEEMMKAGVAYGRKKSKLNPKMKPYIFTSRSGMAIFDLSKTLEGIEKAIEFAKGKIVKGGRILVVGTQPAAKDLARKFAEDLKQFFVVERWLGGTLTNFKTISTRITHFRKLKADRETGKFEKYTKKERLLLDRDIEKFTGLFGGVETMETLPAVVFIIDPVVHDTALREAKKINIPVIAIISSDANPDLVQYPVAGNVGARSSISWILNKFVDALKDVKIETTTKPVA